MRVKLIYEGREIHFVCDSAKFNPDYIFFNGVCQELYMEIDMEGLDFEVEKDGCIKIPQHYNLTVTLEEKDERLITTLRHLAIGEHFKFLKEDQVYVYYGDEKYAKQNESVYQRSPLNTPVLPIEFRPTKQINTIPDYLEHIFGEMIEGTHPTFIYDPMERVVRCKCGHKAVYYRTGFVCGTITAYPCKYVREKGH